MKPTRALTWAALAGLILIWSTTWAVIRVGLRGIPPFTGVALRFALASAALLALAPLLGVKLGRSPNEWRLWIANSLLTFAIPYGVLYWAEQSVPSGLAAVLFATMPLIVAVAAHFALAGDRLTVPGTLGILIGFAGIAVIFSEDFQALGGGQVRTAAAVLLISPLCAGIGSILVKKWGEGVHPISIAAVPMGITALLMGALALLAERGRAVHFDMPSVLAVIYLGIMGSAVPFTVYFWLLKQQTATRMSLINYATPVIAVAVGTLFMEEPFTARIAIGTALVLAGVGVALRKRT
ncbi:MAG TPA: EamA family transporter [Thermoanaerobaculia bacterium]|jgi:drug/metabolite transporter (DMT)-like permease|nr:EamA family transporter [Thermoanaerobaculia bacterium]